MSKNRPAFPGKFAEKGKDGSNQFYYGSGLTRRELFAAMAMQGLCTPAISGDFNFNDKNRERARHAVALADALISELE